MPAAPAAGAGGMGGLAGLAGLFGGGGAGGFNPAALMSNPMVQQMMSDPSFMGMCDAASAA